MFFASADVVVGLQFGSEGKGKVVGWLASKNHYEAAICNFSSQAGHTYQKDGKKSVVQQVPMAVVSNIEHLVIGPGAVVDLEVLQREIDTFGIRPERLHIDPNAIVIEEKHKACERAELGRISSTMKGNGAALADRIMRKASVVRMGDIRSLREFVKPSRPFLLYLIGESQPMLIEAAQGYGLDIDHGMWPHVTSRGCTAQAELARCGIPTRSARNIYGVCRTFPIRVGNTEDGYSGGEYFDQKEIDWEEVTRNSGSPHKLIERTTVTNRVRRVFSFSKFGIYNAVMVNGCTHVCTNFMDYLDSAIHGATSAEEIFRPGKVAEWVDNNLDKPLGNVPWSVQRMYGTGPENSAMVVPESHHTETV